MRIRRVGYSGHSLADYYYRTVCCEKCGGTGAVMLTKDMLRHYLSLQNLTFREKKEVVRMWRRTRDVPCPQCDGLGIYEERF